MFECDRYISNNQPYPLCDNKRCEYSKTCNVSYWMDDSPSYESESVEKNCVSCKRKMVWENPRLSGHFHTSSCDIEDWNICYDCMINHCTSIHCCNCDLVDDNENCRFEFIRSIYGGQFGQV